MAQKTSTNGRTNSLHIINIDQCIKETSAIFIFHYCIHSRSLKYLCTHRSRVGGAGKHGPCGAEAA